MRAPKQNKEYLLDFLMKSNSLNDLLSILKNICKNLELDYLNNRLKHFKYFQFTFFGLMVKARGLLEMMLFKAEFMNNKLINFDKIYQDLIRLKKDMEEVYSFIKSQKMEEGRKKIINVAEKYEIVFENILKLKEKL